MEHARAPAAVEKNAVADLAFRHFIRNVWGNPVSKRLWRLVMRISLSLLDSRLNGLTWSMPNSA